MSTRQASIRVTSVLLAVALFPLVAPVRVASAQTAPDLLVYRLPVDTDVAGPNETHLISIDLALRAGESRRLIGQVDAVMKYNNFETIDDTVAVQCVDPMTGAQVGISAWAEAGLTPGVPWSLRPSLLFTARNDGVFRCHLLAYVGAGSAATVMTAHHDTTYLAVSAADEVGSHFWVNPPCDSTGELTTCTYLDQDNTSVQVFYNDDRTPPDQTPPPLYKWKAADNATLASFTANVEMTTCGHTASCGSGDRHRGEARHSVVTSHLEAVQLDAYGQACNLTVSPWRTDVIGKQHHYNVPYDLPNVPVVPTCGSRNFYVRVLVLWVSDDPVKIDGYQTGWEETLTNALAINSHYAPTTTVPSVIGLTPAAAERPLVEARLHVGAVKNASSFAPAGTIVRQIAAANTIEPIDSPVDLYVSLGVVYYNGMATAAKPATALSLAASRAWAKATAGGYAQRECNEYDSHADPNDFGTYDAVYTLVCKLRQ